MAVAFGCYSLTSKKFPSEFENEFVPRSQSPNERVIEPDDDRRRYMGEDEYPGIGLLRMEFNGTPSFGTATIIANGCCALTCAHNVVDYNDITKEFLPATQAWFELRKYQAGSGCTWVLDERYQVTKIAVYPEYFENPTPGSGFDLALCWIHVPESDRTVKELYSKHEMPIPLVREHAPTCAAVVGFPAKHKGEKWGMVAHVPEEIIKDWIIDKNRQTFVYQFIDTSPGQSGSPVMGMKPSEILGVHTGWSNHLKKNQATAITSAKLQWIADSLGRPWRVGNDYKTSYLCAG